MFPKGWQLPHTILAGYICLLVQNLSIARLEEWRISSVTVVLSLFANPLQGERKVDRNRDLELATQLDYEFEDTSVEQQHTGSLLLIQLHLARGSNFQTALF